MVVKRWLFLLLWMGAIFLVSHQPATELPNWGLWDVLLKKGAHFAAYAVLAVLALRAVGDWQRPYVWAFVITAVYAISDEFHQTFVPGRNGSAWDVLLDAGGGLTALMAMRYRARFSHQWERLKVETKNPQT